MSSALATDNCERCGASIWAKDDQCRWCKEFFDLKAVLGDLLQEKMPKVYTVMRSFRRDVDLMTTFYLTLDSAKRAVAARSGVPDDGARGLNQNLVWTEHDSHGRCWTTTLNAGLDSYVITEHDVVVTEYEPAL